MTNYQFFCKNSDDKVYMIINSDTPSKLQLERKAKWLETTGNILVSKAVEDNSDLLNMSLIKRVGDDIEIDTEKKAFEVKEQFKKDVAAKRKELQIGWMNVACTAGTAIVKNTFDNQLLLETGAAKYRQFPTEIDDIFPSGIAIKTGDGDDDVMVIPTAIIEDLWKMLSMTVQAMFDIETLHIKPQIKSDYDEVIAGSMTLAEFESKDYVTEFDTQLSTRISDTTKFAQPTTEPV